MKLKHALLADAASIDHDGKFDIRGGGITTLHALQFPATVASLVLLLQLDVSPVECQHAHLLQVPFLDPDGQELGSLVAPLRTQPVPGESYREVAEPYLCMLDGVVLPSPGDYAFHILVDGFTLDVVPLYVRKGEPPRPSPSAARTEDVHTQEQACRPQHDAG